MSSPLNPLPDPIEDVPSIPVVTDDGVSAQVQAVLPPPQKSFPAWTGWDVLAISVFTGFCQMLFIESRFQTAQLPWTAPSKL